MGPTRYEDLQENKVVTTLRDVRRATRQIRAVQKTGGSNLHYFRAEPPGTYAWSGVVDGTTQSPSTGGVILDVVLTSKNADVALTDLVIETFYSSNEGATFSQLGLHDYGNAPHLQAQAYPKPGTANTPFKTYWTVVLTADINTTAALKVQALASDEVTVEVARVA